MTLLRVLAIDDEPLALRRIEIVLSAMADVELVGMASSVVTGLALVDELRPDVILLDVSMSGLSGLDFLDRLACGTRPQIIFVTACDRFAIEAFNHEVIDYVLKPFQPARLAQALERARVRMTLAADSDSLRKIVESRSLDGAERDYDRELWAHRYGELVRIPVSELRWAQSERDYVRLHVADGSYLMRSTMGDLTERLDPREFVRIHRSAIVRISAVKAVGRRETGLLVAKLTSGEEINIGRRFARNFAAARTIMAATAASNSLS